MKTSKDNLALALDNVSNLDAITDLVGATREYIGVYKIGLEQFTRFGIPVVEKIQKLGVQIFLDLKFHDIPNTVEKAVASACELNVQYCTLHTLGGTDMLKAAVKAANAYREKGKTPPKLIGVTVLTSVSPEALKNDLQVAMPLTDYVAHLAKNALSSGLDGIVCSAADLPAVQPFLPQNFVRITPGIRFDGGATHDQKRVATPQQAIANGATLLVIGRAVTEAKDPGAAAREIFSVISVQ